MISYRDTIRLPIFLDCRSLDLWEDEMTLIVEYPPAEHVTVYFPSAVKLPISISLMPLAAESVAALLKVLLDAGPLAALPRDAATP